VLPGTGALSTSMDPEVITYSRSPGSPWRNRHSPAASRLGCRQAARRGHRERLLNFFTAKKQFSSGIIEGLSNKAKVTI
jgi:hypothetical protein